MTEVDKELIKESLGAIAIGILAALTMIGAAAHIGEMIGGYLR